MSEASLELRDGKIKYLRSDKDQDLSDTELAIEYLIEEGYSRYIDVINPFGGRLDQCIINILNLINYHRYIKN